MYHSGGVFLCFLLNRKKAAKEKSTIVKIFPIVFFNNKIFIKRLHDHFLPPRINHVAFFVAATEKPI